MPKMLRRMQLEEVFDNLAGVLERVHMEKDFVILVEREGEAVAVVLSPEEYARLSGGAEPYVSDAAIERALAAAGAWSDLDTEAMLEAIYEKRHRPATRPPISFDD